MALKPKSKLIQIRVEPELFDRYKEAAEFFNSTVSAALRSSMMYTIGNHQKYLDRQVERDLLRKKKISKLSK